MKKNIIILFFALFTLMGCEKEKTPLPNVNSNQVGFVNDTDFSVSWGIRFAGNSVNVSSKGSSILPFSSDGYWVNPIDGWDILYSSPNGGQVIVLYKDGSNYRLRVENWISQ